MEKNFVFRCYTYENGMHNGYIIVESLEELAQFIVSNENDKVITDIGDQLIIKTIGSFLDVVPDQQFRLEFMPYLLKAQGYENIDEEYYEGSDESHHENISNDELKRLHELVSIYLSKAKMDEVLIEIYYDVISFDDVLDIVLEDALYDLNFTEDEAKEFHRLVKIYKKEEQ